MHTIGLATGSGATSVSLVTGRFVGLAGLEPAASSLSEIDGPALCYPAFALVVRLRKSYRDGVNLSVQVQSSVLARRYEDSPELNLRGFSEAANRSAISSGSSGML